MKLFSVLDVKANLFLKPISESTTAHAIRSFDAAVNGNDSVFSRYPDDFALCELGTFDEFTGLLTPLPAYVNLGSARSVLREAPVIPAVRQ
nr:MAG: nonstructural protein [Microvirus sp.]